MDTIEKIKCPIKINLDPLKGPVDSQKEVAAKWDAIKTWYKEHPECQTPWDEWESDQIKMSNYFYGEGGKRHLAGFMIDQRPKESDIYGNQD